MCGISGYFSVEPVSQDRIETCFDLLDRRGPDDKGLFQAQAGEHHLGMLHTRLSILDLDRRSAQPFHYQNLVLTFNGEIYNYLEIRAELESLGYEFRTSGDTEVTACAWLRWGADCLNKFDGMWSIAIFDKNSQTLTLATDPFGEKPLYLSCGEDGSVWFGSQINCVATLSGRRPKPNWQHINRYLVNGYKSLYKTSDSFVEGIVNVPGNRIIQVSSEGIKQRPYWKPTRYAPDGTRSRQDHVQCARDALIESVSRRLRADVPMAFCMSGGVDSNSIIAIAAAHLGYDVSGFTILNNDGRYDEKELVEHSSRQLGVNNVQISLQPENFLTSLSQMVEQRHAPVATISYYTQNFLYRSIAERGFKVALSGTGADELFTGYYDHHVLYLASAFSTPALRDRAVENWARYVKPITRNPLLQDENLYLNQPMFRDHVFYKNAHYAEFLKDHWYEEFTETVYSDSLLRNRMMNELFHEAVPVILTEDDANAMAFSVENRSPFLSRPLLDATLSIPDEELVKNGFAKRVLREAMQGLVPDRILWERRKIGFNSSLFEVADVKSHQVREFLLDDGPFYQRVNKQKVEAFLDEELTLNSDSKFLFNLINAKMTVDLMEA